MEHTRALKLNRIMPAQAQKHIPYNETLEILDAIIHLSTLSVQASPPVPPINEGERFLVSSDAPLDASWAGEENSIAAYIDNNWRFFRPNAGWLCWVEDMGKLLVFTDSGWTDTSSTHMSSLGINATPDIPNRFVVSSEASLFNHDGNGHQLKINRHAQHAPASLLFQTNYLGHAECGLTSEDNLQIKVSADGQAWNEAANFDVNTGQMVTPGLKSGQITLANESVATLPTPKVGGIILIMINDPIYPQLSHSGIFAYDIGASPNLVELAAGPKFHTLINAQLNGTSGPSGHSTLGATIGELAVENRYGSTQKYAYTFLC